MAFTLSLVNEMSNDGHYTVMKHWIKVLLLAYDEDLLMLPRPSQMPTLTCRVSRSVESLALTSAVWVSRGE